MSTSLTAAFRSYGAKPKNARWSVSAKASDGSVVISCWQQFFSRGMVYTDRLSRWQGNKFGNDELRRHIEDAVESSLPIRLVIAHLEDNHSLDGVWDASAINKTFSTRPDLTGRVKSFDGDNFTIEFSIE
jgi:hypothetical protein